MKNWAGNVTYSARASWPRSVEEAQELIAGPSDSAARHAPLLQPRRRHPGALLSTEHLDRIVEIGETTVTVEAGIRYGELSSALARPRPRAGEPRVTAAHLGRRSDRHRRLTARACATSRSPPPCRRSSSSRGRLDPPAASRRRRLRRRRRRLGALGLVARVSLDVVPAFELRQYVFENLPWAAVDADLDEILAGGYSVSLFTSGRSQASTRSGSRRPSWLGAYFGATPRTGRATRFRARTRRTPRSSSASRPFGRAVAALPARVHAERRRGAPVGVRRRARARGRRVAGAAAARADRLAAPAHLGDPDDRRGHAVAQPVLRAGQHRVPLHLEAARPTRCSPCCR